jgi:hypothetical protein
MATGLEQSPPVDPVGPSIAIIVQVISPITNGQVARINAAAIMAKMADDLISVGGYLTKRKVCANRHSKSASKCGAIDVEPNGRLQFTGKQGPDASVIYLARCIEIN